MVEGVNTSGARIGPSAGEAAIRTTMGRWPEARQSAGVSLDVQKGRRSMRHWDERERKRDM